MAEVSTTDMGTPLFEWSNPPILQMGMLGLDGPLRVAGTFSTKHPWYRVGRCSKPRAAWQSGHYQCSVMLLGHPLRSWGKAALGEESCLCLQVGPPELGLSRSCAALSPVSGVRLHSSVTQFPHS